MARRPLTLIAALVLGLGGCGPSSATPTAVPPSPSQVPPATSPGPSQTLAPSQDPSAVYGAIASQVEQIRELHPTRSVTPVLIDEAQLRANLTQEFDRANPPAAIEAAQDELIELGLIPTGTSLRQAELDLQAGQVAGYYSPGAGQLYVVSRSGGIGPTQRVTYAHEFTHQLQDQNFDLAKLGLSATDQGDRSLARLALVEGDAVTVQTIWTRDNLSTGDLAQLLADASDPAALAALEHAPAFLRTTVLFPYTSGQAFVGTLVATGGEAAVDAAFRNPPASTAQVLHPELFLAHQVPLAVSLPSKLGQALGSGWRELGRDTLGELQIRTWLEADGVDQATGTEAAAGWAGDRLAILAGPNGQLALAIRTEWTTPTDAAEFSSAAVTALAKASGTGRVASRAGSVTSDVVVAPTAELAQRLLAALGD